MAKNEHNGSTLLRSVMQEAFTDFMLNGACQTDAYLQAYPTCKNRVVAKVNASRLLTKANVKTRIAHKRTQLAKKAEITAERVIKELGKIAFANIQEFIESDNEIKDISKLDPSIAVAVESIQTDIRHDSGKSEGYTEKVKFKLHSKISALESLGRYLGLFAKDNEQRKAVFRLLMIAPQNG